MSQRNLVSYLTLPAVIALASLGYSCATSSGGGDAAAPKAAERKPATVAAAAPAQPAKKPQILPTPPKLAAIAQPAAAEPAPKRLKRAEKPAKAEEGAAGKVMRFVSTPVLNVRAKPSTDSEIVGRLVKGSQLPVEIKGEWAKIGDNQFVQAKYLTPGKSMAAK